MAISFVFNGFKVYDAVEIKDKVPTYFVGCSATILKIIEKKNIPVDQYFFASYSKKDGWKEVSGDYLRRKLLIKADWVENNVPGFMKDKEKESELAKEKYETAPPLLQLNDNEKFVDDDGVPFDIEVRGERSCDKIWFKAVDVGKMLQIEKIRNTLTDSTTIFLEGKDYKTFIQGGAQILGTLPNKIQNPYQPYIYLSYQGLVRLLYVRRHPIANKFTKWASEKLFAMQYGSNDQKVDLVADVLGVGPKDIKAFLNTNVNSMPVVYLFVLGNVKDLRKPLDISESHKDTELVVKYGLTQDLQRRTSEHEKAFKQIDNAVLTLKYHVYIDPMYLSSAENDIEKFFKGAQWHLNHPKHSELAAIPSYMIESIIHNEFKRLGQTYGGKLQDLQQQLAHERQLNDALKKQYADMMMVQEKRIAEQREAFDMLSSMWKMFSLK